MAFKNLDDFLSFQEERMVGIGFNAEKVALCISDMRTGAIALLDAARNASRTIPRRNAQTIDFFSALEAWVEGKKRQSRD